MSIMPGHFNNPEKQDLEGCERCKRGERRYHNLNGYGHRVCPHWWIYCKPNNGERICCELKEPQ